MKTAFKMNRLLIVVTILIWTYMLILYFVIGHENGGPSAIGLSGMFAFLICLGLSALFLLTFIIMAIQAYFKRNYQRQKEALQALAITVGFTFAFVILPVFYILDRID